MHFFMQLSLRNTSLYLPLEALAQTVAQSSVLTVLKGPHLFVSISGTYKSLLSSCIVIRQDAESPSL